MPPVRAQRLRALPMTDLGNYLLGPWHLSRLVIDHGRDRLALEGSAEVRRCPDGSLCYVERAILTSGWTPLEFTRSYRYVPTGDATARIEFIDGSPFHDLDLRSGRCRVHHLCDQDRYLGLVMTTSDGWYTRWRCHGPRKDYVATTYLSRDALAATESLT